MGWLQSFGKSNEERYRLIQLRHEMDRLSNSLRNETKGLQSSSEEFGRLLGDFSNSIDLVVAEISEIETGQMLRRVEQWKIPLEPRPYSDASTEAWEWNRIHGRHYLTPLAMSRIRREAYQEWEMMTKPYLAWAAIAISIVSLIVSVFKP